ncbi:hypothetical protein M885DRAFT_616064 [Pelagophyceae sp. CCMP2097]|nr:hypothetical protein M885DRAFT_616064 [Pelagophyceae sp. CCMP2097]
MDAVVCVRREGGLDLSACERLWYDGAQAHVVVQRRGSQVLEAFDLEGRAARSTVAVGAPVLCAKYSLDGGLVAAQISDTVVLVAQVDGNQRWRIDVAKSAAPSLNASLSGLRTAAFAAASSFGADVPVAAKPAILRDGLVWSEHGGSSQDLVVVTSRGAELYKVSVGRGQCQRVRSLSYDVRHFWFDASRRLLLLGCGDAGGVLRPFWLRRDVSDLPRFELPPPEKVRKLELEAAHNVAADPVEQQDVQILGEVYDEAFIAHVERKNAVVRLYHVNKERCLLWCVLKLGQVADRSPPRLSVSDNLVYVHFRSAKVTLLFDIRCNDTNGANVIEPVCGACAATIDDDADGAAASADGLYGAWLALGDSRFLDVKSGVVYAVACGLRAAARRVEAARRAVPFLLRRRPPDASSAEDAVGAIVAARIVDLVRCGAAADDLDAVFDVVVREEAAAAARDGSVISPVAQHALRINVFAALLQREEDAEAARDALLAYVSALRRGGVAASPDLAVLLVSALAAGNDDAAQLLRAARGLLPDSQPLAKALLDCGGDALRQHACDMLHRLGLWREVVDVAARRGEFCRCVAVARQHATAAERRHLSLAKVLARAALRHCRDAPGDRVQTLGALHDVLRDWRPASLQPASNKPFPLHLFDDDEAARLYDDDPPR